MTADQEAFSAQDQIDLAKFQEALKEVSNRVLMQLRRDINEEHDRRVDEIIGEDDE